MSAFRGHAFGFHFDFGAAGGQVRAIRSAVIRDGGHVTDFDGQSALGTLAVGKADIAARDHTLRIGIRAVSFRGDVSSIDLARAAVYLRHKAVDLRIPIIVILRGGNGHIPDFDGKVVIRVIGFHVDTVGPCVAIIAAVITLEGFRRNGHVAGGKREFRFFARALTENG